MTAAEETPSTLYSTNTYGYNDADWGDLLTSFNGHTITYDAIGNPLNYYNGSSFSFTWKNGRQLATAAKGTYVLSYDYNDEGIRTKKVVNGVEHTYHLSGSQIVAEEWGSDLCVYLYDADGSPIGMQYRTTSMAEGDFYTFWFEKNLQGDIVAVYNESGTKVYTYQYDAWGNCTATPVSSIGANIYAQYNPFRYRGYYYDSELGMYYLQSRYYDPAVGRFINADNIEYLGAGSITGYNLFAYCGNNPVTGYDPAGTLDWGNLFKGSGWLAVGVTAIAVGVSVLTCGVAAPAIMAVAAVTVAAGAATAVNGVSELGEAATGHNFMRDDVFRGNEKAYNTYAHTTAAVAEIGTMICGGWLKANAPRIEAYNNVQNYTYADGAAKHVGERSYYDSTLLKKEIIKYGTMTNEGGGVYTFRAAGTAFSNVRQTFQSGIWELTTINGRGLIGHFLLRS